MTPLAIRRHPAGPRLYVAGRRLHHGPLGAALAAITFATWRRSPRGRTAAAILLTWAATDYRDFPFRDTDNHYPRGRA